MVYITILYCLFHVQVENHCIYNYFILPISCTGGKPWYIKLSYTAYFMNRCKTMVYITISYSLFHVRWKPWYIYLFYTASFMYRWKTMVYITILYCLFHVQVENHGKYNYFILPISCTGGKQWYIKLFYTAYFM